MKWHSLKVGVICWVIFLPLDAFCCWVNYAFGDWADGFTIPLGVMCGFFGLTGLTHVIGWLSQTWDEY